MAEIARAVVLVQAIGLPALVIAAPCLVPGLSRWAVRLRAYRRLQRRECRGSGEKRDVTRVPVPSNIEPLITKRIKQNNT